MRKRNIKETTRFLEWSIESYKNRYCCINQDGGDQTEYSELNYQELNEKLHIQDKFDNFIEMICDKILETLEICLKINDVSIKNFTGYYYNPGSGLCIKKRINDESKSESLHRWNIYYSIDKNDDDTTKAWTEYDNTCIDIRLNLDFFSKNNNCVTYDSVYSILGHEFLHVRELYTINGFKRPKYKISPDWYRERFLYLLKNDEAAARINEVAKKIKKLGKEEINKITSSITSKYQASLVLANYFEDILFLGELKKKFRSLKSNLSRFGNEHELSYKGRLMNIRMMGIDAARTKVLSFGIYFDSDEPYPAREYDLESLIQSDKRIIDIIGRRVQKININTISAISSLLDN